MDKLIELLNEYEKIAPSRLQRKYYSESWHIMYIDEEWEDVDDYRTDYEIISKDYGFIKRLVDNDKIDKVKQVIKDIDIWGSDTITLVDTYSDYESLLMLLAIQENSIDVLISILK
jgi:hypothetical protein